MTTQRTTTIGGEVAADTRAAVTDAVVRSWRNVDIEGGEGAELYYAVDAEFTTPAVSLLGRPDIKEGHAARTASAPRLSRHVVSNLLVDDTGDGRAEARYTLTVYGADGTAPIELKGASAVCDLHDSMSFIDGAWLIVRREIVPVFVAPHNDSIMLRGVSP